MLTRMLVKRKNRIACCLYTNLGDSSVGDGVRLSRWGDDSHRTFTREGEAM